MDKKTNNTNTTPLNITPDTTNYDARLMEILADFKRSWPLEAGDRSVYILAVGIEPISVYGVGFYDRKILIYHDTRILIESTWSGFKELIIQSGNIQPITIDVRIT